MEATAIETTTAFIRVTVEKATEAEEAEEERMCGSLPCGQRKC